MARSVGKLPEKARGLKSCAEKAGATEGIQSAEEGGSGSRQEHRMILVLPKYNFCKNMT